MRRRDEEMNWVCREMKGQATKNCREED